MQYTNAHKNTQKHTHTYSENEEQFAKMSFTVEKYAINETYNNHTIVIKRDIIADDCLCSSVRRGFFSIWYAYFHTEILTHSLLGIRN